MGNLKNYFEAYLNTTSIFSDKHVLQSNYFPTEVNHRNEQITQVAKILAPALRGEKPSNLFIYGKTGTGKTLCVKHTTSQMSKVASEKGIALKVCYLNCKLKKIADTEYRLIAQLAREFGKAIPPTGLPTDEVYNTFFSALDAEKQIVLLVLDEIDQLVKKAGDEIIYNLTRINSDLKNSQVSIIGISNDLMFSNNLDPRVKSSLSEEELLFPPYNALQIQEILKERADIAFKEGALQEGVIQKCAAYAAREHGDARRALELLRVAGELAERSQQEQVTTEQIDSAEDKIEHDRVYELVKTQPKQHQLVLFSILNIKPENSQTQIYTGEVYDYYKGLCDQVSQRPLTQRRVSDVIQEMDMLGIINANVISKGRFGRTREISLAIHHSLKTKIMTTLKDEVFS
ncbi:MAG: ORC1-type DNA replication protein [Candidatus Woesearchaeota archaeon]